LLVTKRVLVVGGAPGILAHHCVEEFLNDLCSFPAW
jgi:hypothetical protein